MQLTCDPLGIHGDSVGQVTAGGLQTDPDLFPNPSGTVYVNATSPQEAVRQAVVGTVQVNVLNQTTSYTFSATSSGTTTTAGLPFYVVPAVTSTVPPGPPSPVTELVIHLEDLANFPAQNDGDYNDHYWTITVVDVDAQETGTGTISGTVWDDTASGNGVQDAGDPQVADVTVELFRNGVHRGTAYTDANGVYTFAQLPAGTYQVLMTGRTEGLPVPPDEGTDDGIDSDVGDDGRSDVIDLPDGGTADRDIGITALPQPQGFDGQNYGIMLVDWRLGAKAAPELRVAKWETAFESGGSVGIGKPVLRSPDPKTGTTSSTTTWIGSMCW